MSHGFNLPENRKILCGMMKSFYYSQFIFKVKCEVFFILEVSIILWSLFCFLNFWKKIDLESFFPVYWVSLLFYKTIIFFLLLFPGSIGVFSAKTSIAVTFSTCKCLKRSRHTSVIARGRVESTIQCSSFVNPVVLWFFLHIVLEKHFG